MARVTRKEWYRRVNESWPDIVPPLTGEEAVRAAKRLYRFVTKRTWQGDVRVSSGNRRVKVSEWRGVIVVNPEQGWRDMVHEMSHWLERYAGTHGHNAEHARLEMRMIKEVVRRGWLDGKLKTPARAVPAPVDERAVKIARTAAAIQRWETKLRRADNALKKLRRRQRAYERLAIARPAQSAARTPRAPAPAE